jgi:hypothetical protein
MVIFHTILHHYNTISSKSEFSKKTFFPQKKKWNTKCKVNDIKCIFKPMKTVYNLESISGDFMWDSWHMKWHWSTFFSEFPQFSLANHHSTTTPYSSILFFYGSTALAGLGHFFSSLTYTQSVGLLRWVISPSQGRYLHTGYHKHRTNAHRHPCLDWDSNPQSQRSSERRQFMP